MPGARSNRQEREQLRWLWYEQARDVIGLAAGLTTLGFMVWRDSYPLPGVLVVFVCIGSLTSSAAIKVLLGRWSNGNGGKR